MLKPAKEEDEDDDEEEEVVVPNFCIPRRRRETLGVTFERVRESGVDNTLD